MRYLSWSCAKTYLLVPLLAICTAFFFLLFLYWYPNLRKKFFYSEVNDIRKATHLFIIGTCNISTCLFLNAFYSLQWGTGRL
jgi:hypothetical protein